MQLLMGLKAQMLTQMPFFSAQKLMTFKYYKTNTVNIMLTLCILMDSSFWFDTNKLGTVQYISRGVRL